MKKHIIILIFLLSGCGGDKSRDDEFAPENKLPNEEKLYTPLILSQGRAFTELNLQNKNALALRVYVFDENSIVFYSTDKSHVDGGKSYITLSTNGWIYSTTEDRRLYSLNKDGDLVNNQGISRYKCVNFEEQTISGLPVMDTLGEYFSWAEPHTFSNGARLYVCKDVYPETTWTIEHEYCGQDCYDWPVLGNTSITEWREQYKAIDNPDLSNGFYYLGLSLFFDDSGAIHAYEFINPERGLLSTLGHWKIISINGEEVFEMEIPINVKRQFGIIDEANPIISSVSGTLLKGTKLTSSYSVEGIETASVDYFVNGYYFNNVAIEDLKSAYISNIK